MTVQTPPATSTSQTTPNYATDKAKMAKSQRSSVTKANNQRLKKNVFGPVEAARQQRLSARLLEIASQPKPVPEKDMKDAAEQGMSECTCPVPCRETGIKADIVSITAETEETKPVDETKQDDSELDHLL